MDFARYSDRHRTSLAHFLSKGKWDSAALEKNLRESVIEKVYQHSRETNQPVLCIIDDTIAGLKTNRILYPCGIRTPLNEFASKLRKTDVGVRLISVGKRKYWIYRYDGQINGTDGAAVILTYPENAFGKPKALRAFLCTNADLSVEHILNLYTKRWPVEVFFRTTKGKLALDKYQLRSATGIRRFWLLMSLTHFLCCVGSGVLRSFSEGYEYWQTLVLRNVVQHVYNCGKNGTPLAMLGIG